MDSFKNPKFLQKPQRSNPSKTCNRSLIALNIELFVVVAWIPRYYTQKEEIFRVFRVAFWGFLGWMVLNAKSSLILGSHADFGAFVSGSNYYALT